MKLKNKIEFFAAPAKIFVTVVIILIVVMILQALVIEIAWAIRHETARSVTPAAKETGEPNEAEQKLARIRSCLKDFLPDGTVHLISSSNRRPYSQPNESVNRRIYDVNDNLLWEGVSSSPYKYLSWADIVSRESFRLQDMKWLNMISPDMCRSLEVPIRTEDAVVEIWRYLPGRACFVGYEAGGGRIGYIGAAGLADSAAKAEPFGEFVAFFAWCPDESSSPVLVWQTNRRIFEISFEDRKVEMLCESTAGDIQRLSAGTWGNFRPRNFPQEAKKVDGYRPLLVCQTDQGSYNLILRDPDQRITVETPAEWNLWHGNYCRFAIAEEGIFLNRFWVEVEQMPRSSESNKDREKWLRDYREKIKKQRTELYKVDDNGNLSLLSSFAWTTPADSITVSIATRSAARRYVSLVSPALYDPLLYFGFRYYASLDRTRQDEFLREIFGMLRELHPGLSVWNWVLTAIMVGFTAWHAWPRRTSTARLVFWLVFVAAFNLAGLLTYLALNHTQVIKCPACGRHRGLNRPDCVRCRRELPTPKPGRLDLILDTHIKPAT
ncbi:MAG: hypothetical protein JW720_15740 [Sedimentisphaerales bacterium]|nr:hypothetical protein [Sedimentisphaerales bacterium]